MKTKLILITLCMISIKVSAQDPVIPTSVQYTYDNAGNRDSRNYTLSFVNETNNEIQSVNPEVASLQTEPSAEFKFLEEELTLKMYPNPVHDMLIVEVTEGELKEVVTLKVTNTSGQVVKSVSLSDPMFQLDTSDLSSGLYVLTAMLSEETLNWTLVKQ